MDIITLQRAIQEQEPQIWELENNEGFYGSDFIPSYRAFPPRHKDELQYSVVEPLSKIDNDEIKLKILLGIIDYFHIDIPEDKPTIINNNYNVNMNNVGNTKTISFFNNWCIRILEKLKSLWNKK